MNRVKNMYGYVNVLFGIYYPEIRGYLGMIAGPRLCTPRHETRHQTSIALGRSRLIPFCHNALTI